MDQISYSKGVDGYTRGSWSFEDSSSRSHLKKGTVCLTLSRLLLNFRICGNDTNHDNDKHRIDDGDDTDVDQCSLNVR